MQVFLRPLGSPLPLGFGGLVVATLVVACFNLGWIPSSEQHQVGIVLVAFAFPLQVIATVLLFLVRDAPSGAGVGVQAVTWLTFGLLLITSSPGSRSTTAAVLLFGAAAALLPSAVTTSYNKMVVGGVMLGTALRFVLTAVYEVEGSRAWSHATGWEGLVLAGFALYTALGSDIEATVRRTILPLGKRKGEYSAHAVSHLVEQEPGVRQPL